MCSAEQLRRHPKRDKSCGRPLRRLPDLQGYIEFRVLGIGHFVVHIGVRRGYLEIEASSLTIPEKPLTIFLTWILIVLQAAERF